MACVLMPLSQDLRQRVLDAYSAGEGSIRQLAHRFKVSASFVHELLQLHRQTGSLAPRPRAGGYPCKLDPPTLEQIRVLCLANTDSTLGELCALLKEHHGRTLSVPTMYRALSKLGLTHKKNTARR